MPKIDQIFAFIAEDEGPDDEGITSFHSAQHGGWMPMVAADEKRIDSLRQFAQAISDESGKKITLIRFSQREVVEVIAPKASKH